jgi:hypothetical protein
MNKLIIYKNDDGGVDVVCPAPDCGLTVEQIAIKDVPAGKPFKIINRDELPEDMTFRTAWEVEIESPDGHGIGHEEWFARLYAQKAKDAE